MCGHFCARDRIKLPLRRLVGAISALQCVSSDQHAWANRSDIPWVHFNTLQTVWGNMPTFLVIELAFYCLTLATLYHACSTNRLALWFSSGIAGTTQDTIFVRFPPAAVR